MAAGHEARLRGKERRAVEELEHELAAHMAEAKPRRYEHSLSVARTAEELARSYGVDPFLARVAGILHDWDKVLDARSQLAKARDMGIDLGVDLSLVQPLLHGLTAARELRERHPELPAEVWQAIERHTIGAADMSGLDMVLFVADGIEPLRRESPGIARVRSMAWRGLPLSELYWESFAGGMSYVIETGRYLYPGTLSIYNALVSARTKEDPHVSNTA